MRTNTIGLTFHNHPFEERFITRSALDRKHASNTGFKIVDSLIGIDIDIGIDIGMNLNSALEGSHCNHGVGLSVNGVWMSRFWS